MPRDQLDTPNEDRALKLFGPQIDIPSHWYGRRAPSAPPSDLWLRVLATHIRATTRSARSSTADFHNARP